MIFFNAGAILIFANFTSRLEKNLIAFFLHCRTMCFCLQFGDDIKKRLLLQTCFTQTFLCRFNWFIIIYGRFPPDGNKSFKEEKII